MVNTQSATKKTNCESCAKKLQKNSCKKIYSETCLILFCEFVYNILPKIEFVGNTAKGQISKRVFQESKARQNFRKTNISYPLIRERF